MKEFLGQRRHQCVGFFTLTAERKLNFSVTGGRILARIASVFVLHERHQLQSFLPTENK
jgi:hypothetical protein